MGMNACTQRIDYELRYGDQDPTNPLVAYTKNLREVILMGFALTCHINIPARHR